MKEFGGSSFIDVVTRDNAKGSLEGNKVLCSMFLFDSWVDEHKTGVT